MKKNIYKITAIASLGICLSLAANCAKANNNLTQNSGLDPNLIKTANSPTVYFVANNKRHKILTEEVFLDYGFNWNDIKIVTEEQLRQYPIAKVAKSPASSRVYYINESLNKKKFIPAGAIFLAYGNKWEDIVTISPKDLESYSNIAVIKSVDSSKVYELKDGIKNIILNPKEFTDKGYKWNEIVTVKDDELNYYPTKIVINGEEVVVAGVEYDENGYAEEQDDFTSQIISGNSYLSIKTIKEDKEITVPSGSIVPMLKLQLTAGLEKPVNVNFLKISRVKGISSIKNIIVADEDNNALGNTEMLDKSYVSVRLKPELYIAPNKSKIIYINASIRDNDYIAYDQLLIESEKDISTVANIEGTFPLIGDRIRIIPGNDLIGKAEVGAVVVSDGLRNAHIGETDRLITKFSFRETTGNEDVYLKILRVANSGSSYVKLANVDLIDQDNRVIATVADPTGSNIVFDISRTPYKIPKGSSRILGIKADIISGAGGSIKFEIKDENCILITGKEYLFNLTISSQEGSKFPIGHDGGKYVNMIMINDVDVTVYKNDKSAVGGVVAGSDEQSLGIFNVRVNGSTINLKAVTLQILNGDKVGLEGDLIIRDYKTKKMLGQVPASLASNSPQNVELDVYPKIETKQTFAFEVLGNLNDKAAILDTYQLEITGIGFQLPGSNLDHDVNFGAVSGNVLSVKRSSLTISSNSALKDAEVPAGKTKVLIGGFILQAGVAEDLVVNSFNIAEVTGYDPITKKPYGALGYSEGYSNLKIYVNKKEYAAYPAPTSGQIIADKPFTIGAGKSASIAIYVDTSPLVDNDKIQLEINNVKVYGKVSDLEPSQTGSNSKSLTVKFKQSKLVISKNTKMEDTSIEAGKSNQKIASFSFNNEGVENIVIKNFTLAETESPIEISYDNGYSNIKTSGKGLIKKPIAGGNIFGGFTIKAGATVVMDVYITTSASIVSNNFKLVLKDIQVASGIVVKGNNVVGQNVRVAGK